MNDQADHQQRLKLIQAIASRFDKRNSFNRKYSAYYLKHIVELELSHQTRGYFIYCSEAELIEAMIASDFDVLTSGRKHFFNVSGHSINQIRHYQQFPNSDMKPRHKRTWKQLTKTEIQGVRI